MKWKATKRHCAIDSSNLVPNETAGIGTKWNESRAMEAKPSTDWQGNEMNQDQPESRVIVGCWISPVSIITRACTDANTHVQHQATLCLRYEQPRSNETKLQEIEWNGIVQLELKCSQHAAGTEWWSPYVDLENVRLHTAPAFFKEPDLDNTHVYTTKEVKMENYQRTKWLSSAIMKMVIFQNTRDRRQGYTLECCSVATRSLSPDIMTCSHGATYTSNAVAGMTNFVEKGDQETHVVGRL